MRDLLSGDPLRASNFDQIIGQDKLKERLELHMTSAVLDKRSPGHVLLMARPGFGKTTIARAAARLAGLDFDVFIMPVTMETLVRRIVIDGFEGVLLLDEIHRATAKQQEELLPLIEANFLQLRGEKFWVPEVTIFGATTEPRKLIKPLRDRFPFKPDFDPYSDEEMAKIVKQMMRMFEIDLDDESCAVLGRATAGVPRLARDFAFAARDIRAQEGEVPSTTQILDHLRIDQDGLSLDHVRYLDTLRKMGGQAGLRPLSTMLQMNDSDIEELETLLLQLDYINYSDRGRALRTAGYEKLRKVGV